MELSLTKYVEYLDERDQKWKPLVWYSNRDCSLCNHREGESLLQHDHVSVENLPALRPEMRGTPSNISSFVKDKLDRSPEAACGVTYYYLSELKKVEKREIKLIETDIAKGITVELYDKDGENPLEMRAYTISQLKRIHDLFTFLVYDVHGFIPDDKIRVIFYYGQE